MLKKCSAPNRERCIFSFTLKVFCLLRDGEPVPYGVRFHQFRTSNAMKGILT